MATKKRKSTRKPAKRATTKKEAPVEHELPGGFWRQITAVFMMALSLFLVVTWFGHGGDILNEVHKYMYQGIGFATYFVPALLVYLAIRIFRSDDNRVAAPIYIASVLMVIWLSGIAAIWSQGGLLGKYLNDLALNVLDQAVVIFIYLVLIFVTALFILQLSPVTFFKGTKNLVKHNKTKEPKSEKTKLGELEIKVNSGLENPEPAGKITKGFKVKKPAPAVEMPEKAPVKEEKALIAASDPDWKMPSLNLLEKKQSPADAGNINQNAYIIQTTFAEFGINVEMEGANVGPSITQYTMRAPAGINLSKIAARDKELAYNLAAKTVRDRKSTRLNSSHRLTSRMPSSA